MSEDEQRRILQLLAIEKEQRRLHESLKKWATENFAIFGHWKRAAEIKERAAENFSVLKYAPAKACSKKCTAGSKVTHRGERYYHCKERVSSFSRAGHIKRHLLTRSDEKPTKCTQCDYACSRVSSSYHIKTHFLQKPNQSKTRTFWSHEWLLCIVLH